MLKEKYNINMLYFVNYIFYVTIRNNIILFNIPFLQKLKIITHMYVHHTGRTYKQQT